MAFGKRTAKQATFNPWYAFLLVVVLGVTFGMRIYYGLKPDVGAPTADVPAVTYEEVVNEPPVVTEPEVIDEPAPETVVEPEPPNQVSPAQFNLAVPFTSQAPTGNWDPLHEDACEEASFYMVQQFYAGIPAGKIDPNVADPELQRMVHAGESLAQGPSISLAEAQEFLLADSKTVSHVIDNPTVFDIKSLLAEGKPVIVPAAGRELGNPFFTGEGPLYHMLVIRGYTETTFITNDPGTRLGENYAYDIDVLMAAIGDWNNSDPTHGASRILYLDPQ
ncbi:MAG: C39 family peptidase [Patescibacteria group bacterium]